MTIVLFLLSISSFMILKTTSDNPQQIFINASKETFYVQIKLYVIFPSKYYKQFYKDIPAITNATISKKQLYAKEQHWIAKDYEGQIVVR